MYSAKGGSFLRNDWLKTPHKWLISTAIINISASRLKEVEKLPPVIAIDEYKGDTNAGKYQLIIANGETKEPLD